MFTEFRQKYISDTTFRKTKDQRCLPITEVLPRLLCFPKRFCRRSLLWLLVLLLLSASFGYLYGKGNTIQNLDSLRSLNFSDVVGLYLDQDDPRLVDYVLSSGLFLEDGSSLPYRLRRPEHEPDPAEKKMRPIMEHIFNSKVGGRFIEAGAFDGEHDSPTLILEKDYNWKGLLVEPSPTFHIGIRLRNRKANLLKACFSTKKRAMQVNFLETYDMSAHILNSGFAFGSYKSYKCQLAGQEVIINVEQKPKLYTQEWLEENECQVIISVNCLPVYTVLLALGYTNVDFFSLDTEGTELQILRTIPLDKVHIKVFRIEVALLKDEEIKEIKEILHNAGYDRLQSHKDFNFKPDDDELFFAKRRSWLDLIF